MLIVDGGWSYWGPFSYCSEECGGGEKIRERSCTHPAPSNGGAECEGDSEESMSCNEHPCPGKYNLAFRSSTHIDLIIILLLLNLYQQTRFYIRNSLIAFGGLFIENRINLTLMIIKAFNQYGKGYISCEE